MARYNKACIQKESAVNAIQSVSDKPLSEIAELYEDRKSSVRSRGNSKGLFQFSNYMIISLLLFLAQRYIKVILILFKSTIKLVWQCNGQ